MLAEWYNYRAKILQCAVKAENTLIIDCYSYPNEIAADVCIGFNDDDSKPAQEVLDFVCVFAF